MLESNEKMIFFLAAIFNDFTSEEMETLWSLFKKLYRFDGEGQDGFEENISMTVDVPIDYEIGVLKELSRRRNR